MLNCGIMSILWKDDGRWMKDDRRMKKAGIFRNDEGGMRNGGILSILLIPVMIGSRFTVQRLRMMDTAPNNNQNLISSSYLIE